MDLEGTVHGNRIELDETIALPEGTRVKVQVIESVSKEPKPGTVAALRQVLGILSEEDADELLKGAMESRRIDPELWK